MNDTGRDTSLALDGSGHPHISFYRSGTGGLGYAHWTGSAWDIETVMSGWGVGQYTSLALDALGHPHVSFYDGDWRALRYAVQFPVQTFIPLFSYRSLTLK